jgi:hypothetical protein
MASADGAAANVKPAVTAAAAAMRVNGKANFTSTPQIGNKKRDSPRRVFHDPLKALNLWRRVF